MFTKVFVLIIQDFFVRGFSAAVVVELRQGGNLRENVTVATISALQHLESQLE
jgi:hypothetical protein